MRWKERAERVLEAALFAACVVMLFVLLLVAMAVVR